MKRSSQRRPKAHRARATAGKRVATVEQDLSAITAAHRLAGFPSPRESAVVLAARRGIRRELGVVQGQRAPLLAETLKAMVRELPDTLAGLRDRALFAGGLRRRLPPQRTGGDRGRGLGVGGGGPQGPPPPLEGGP